MKAKKGFKLRPLGDEFILVGEGLEQVNFNKMITMNETAAFLWRQVENGDEFTVETLLKSLTQEYEVSEEQALKDINQTIESWSNIGIIE